MKINDTVSLRENLLAQGSKTTTYKTGFSNRFTNIQEQK